VSRQVRRVPLDWDFPVGDTWTGYLRPDDLDLPQCPDCGGRGYSPRARELFDQWYGYVPFSPEDNGSTPLTAATPAVRAFAERNVERATEFYGRGERAIVREADRLARLWNGQWSHHVNTDDVAALVEAGRLMDLTHRWSREDGWRPIVPAVTPTPAEVNEWSIRGLGHDAINASVVVRARCERAGISTLCARCGGEGDVATPEQRAAADAWEQVPPPTGDGWQLWQTVSEGGPVSPVFGTPEELADWIIASGEDSHGANTPRDRLIRWITDDGHSVGSFAFIPGRGMVSGVDLAAESPIPGGAP
jgi:hypothetical protein